jgi:hypothetical protein
MRTHAICTPLVFRAGALLLLTLTIACAGVRPAESPIDWGALEDWSVFVVTLDQDGSQRVTRIWVAVVDGAGAIRTKDSRWWANLQRGSVCALRVGGVDYPVAVEVVTDPGLRGRIDAAFHAKYGWQDRLASGAERAASADPYMRLTAAAR